MKPDTTPAPATPAAGGTVPDASALGAWLMDQNVWGLFAGSVLVLVLAWLLVRKVAALVRRVTAGKPGHVIFSKLLMIGLLGWSAEAMFVIAKDDLGMGLGLTLMLFAVFEGALLLTMDRAERHFGEFGWAGRYGKGAWTIAALMSLIGMFASHRPVEIVIRAAVPLLSTYLWWDGLHGGSPKEEQEAGHWNWGIRQILIRIGALKPGRQDVKQVQRDHLTQRMTTLYHDSLYGSEKKQKALKSKLVRLTLDADDEIIRDVMARVGRASWVDAQPLPYALTHSLTGELAQQITEAVTQQVAHQIAQLQSQITQPDTQGFAQHDARVALPLARRAKSATHAVTSGYAPGEDAGTQAARYAITHKVSNREAAQKFGVSDGTVRNRRKAIEDASAQNEGAQTETNGHAVMADADH